MESNLETRHSIPSSLQMLLTDLDFLGQISRNIKPCCGPRVLVDANSWSGAFYRFFKGENRTNDGRQPPQTEPAADTGLPALTR